MKKLIGLIVAIVIVFVGVITVLSLVPLSSGDIYDGYKVDNGYDITSAHYDITVSKDHSATVVETIEVKFYKSSRGISRWLPTASGEQYSDISVDGDIYYLSSDSDFIFINTGSDFEYKYGAGRTQKYVFSYKIVPPVRTIGNSNYYMNVVPFGWDTNQYDVAVTMKFPFEAKDIKVYSGKYKTKTEIDQFELNDNKTELSISGLNLDPFNGITVDAEFERTFNVNFSLVGLLSIIGILAIIGIALCVKLFAIKDRTVFPVINAKPPTNNGVELDPAQMGYLIDNNCEPSDITAMIFYFASKGLITLENTGGDQFVLIKNGELSPDAPKHQHIIFNGLFKKGDRVTSQQLTNSFYADIALATANIKSGHNGKLYEKKAKNVSVCVATVCCVIAVMIAAFATVMLNYTLLIHGFFVPLIVMVVFVVISFLLGRYVFDNKHKMLQKKLVLIYLVSAAVVLIASLIASELLLGGILPFYGRMMLFAGIATAGFICGLINRKTEYYVSLMNEIVGFKTFLETAEKEKLEAMLEDNPQYYYDILPYANVLGVSTIWEGKFKELASIPPPNYYYGPTVFDFMIFNSLIRTSSVRFTSAMVSRPRNSSYSGRGGFGGFGGGFGGGGFGGGGGGRR